MSHDPNNEYCPQNATNLADAPCGCVVGEIGTITKATLADDIEGKWESWVNGYARAIATCTSESGQKMYQEKLITCVRQALTRTRERTIEECSGVVEEKHKAHWHIRWEETKGKEEEHRKYNDEVTILLNSVIDDALAAIRALKGKEPTP